MKTVALQKHKILSDSDQTIADIRKYRLELSEKYRTWEDIQRFQKEVDTEMKALRLRNKKAFSTANLLVFL